jgi:hypothetical protein
MIDPYRMIYVNLILSALLLAGILCYRFLYPKKKINYLYLIILVSLLPIVSIFREGTYEAGDLTLHSDFLRSFYENLAQGNLIPQWGGNLCAGYGCPNHLFEYPLPYYIAAPFHFLGFSYINSIKIFLAISYILSGIGMYLWLKEELGDLYGFTGAIFYLFAPYHLEDLHFRVSAGEVAAYFPIPFIFYFFKKLSETKKIRFLVLGAISVSLLILAHGNAFMSTTPAIFIYCCYLIFRSKEKMKLSFSFLLSYLLGFFLTAYYWVSPLFEIQYTWYSQGFATTGDFKPFFDYIYSPVRYGLLFQGHHGELRVIIGYFHLLAVLSALFLLIRKKILHKYTWLVIFLLINFFFYFFMIQKISAPLWTLPLLHTFVMPWRLLIPMALITSTIAAIIAKSINNNKIIYVLCFLTAISTILNWGNRRMVPEDTNSFAKEESMYSEYYDQHNQLYQKRLMTRSHIHDLLLQRPSSHLEVLSGNGEIKELARTMLHHEYIVYAPSDLQLSENTYYFPGWKVYVNGAITPVNIQNKNHFGTLTFSLKKGLYLVEAKFEDTPVRKIGTYLSLFSLFLLALISFKRDCIIVCVNGQSLNR